MSRGFRDPVLSDRYFRGPSGRGFITGNPDLEAETSLQFDLATRYTMARTQFGVFFYQYRINDLIERYQTQTDFFFFRNRGRARLRGFEVEARSDAREGLLGGSRRAGRARARARRQREPRRHLAGHASPCSGARSLAIACTRRRASRSTRKTIGRGRREIAAPGATLLDVGAGWRLLPQLELRGLLRNLLDDEYYASPDARWVLAPGRSASLTAVVQF